MIEKTNTDPDKEPLSDKPIDKKELKSINQETETDSNYINPQFQAEAVKEQIKTEDAAVTEFIEENNFLRFEYSTRSFRVTVVWIAIIVVFLSTQVINSDFFIKLNDNKYIATVVSLSTIICGFWAIVGKGLFQIDIKDLKP